MYSTSLGLGLLVAAECVVKQVLPQILLLILVVVLVVFVLQVQVNKVLMSMSLRKEKHVKNQLLHLSRNGRFQIGS